LILPNIKLFEKVVRPEIEEDGPRRKEAEMCVSAIVGVLKLLEDDFQYPLNPLVGTPDEIRNQLFHHVGEIVGEEVWRLRREGLVRSILEVAAAGV
jgi:transcription initiation factor TFIID subunit 6